MKSSGVLVIFGLVLAAFLLMSSQASPMGSPDRVQLEELEVFGRSTAAGDLIRMKRASCDLFSWTSDKFTPNHSVCAAHCIALGKRGGECRGTVCHCRK